MEHDSLSTQRHFNHSVERIASYTCGTLRIGGQCFWAMLSGVLRLTLKLMAYQSTTSKSLSTWKHFLVELSLATGFY